MGAAEDAVRPFQNLADALSPEAAKLGLHLQGLAILPPLEHDSPSQVQIVFVIDETQQTRAPDQDIVDASFEGIVAADRDHTEKERLDEARRDLLELGRSLRPEQGIGLEEPE